MSEATGLGSVGGEEPRLDSVNFEDRASSEAQRYFIGAQTRNERRIWILIGPMLLLGSVTIVAFWQDRGMQISIPVMVLLFGLGLLYTGLLAFWKGPVPTWLAGLMVTMEGLICPALVLSDAAQDPALARSSSAIIVGFVAIAFASLRYRPWLVVYAGLLGAGALILAYPNLCGPEADALFFCHPLLYWWRPVFLLMVAFAGAITVEAAIKTFSVAERTLLQKAQTDRIAAQKSQFLTSVTHELRTPLNSILVLSRLLSQSDENSEKSRRQAQVIHNAGSSLLALINDLLDMSKIEAGRMELNPENIHLETFGNDLSSLFTPIAAEKSLGFHLSRDPGTPEKINTDQLRLEQVLRNLIGNALKFTDTGAVSVRFHAVDESCLNRLKDADLRAQINDDLSAFLAVSIIDTGIGVSEDAQERIFQAFAQADADTAKRFGGTGLGLSICRELATLMGGGLGLECPPAGGSIFTLVLPVGQVEDTELTQSEEEHTLVDAVLLAESTNPNLAATTRIRQEVLRSATIPQTPSLALEESSVAPTQVWPGRTAVVAHENVLINYQVAARLEEFGFSVLAKTQAKDVEAKLAEADKPDLLIVSDYLCSLAPAFAGPTYLVHGEETGSGPLPPGVDAVLHSPLDKGKLQALLHESLGPS